MVALHDRDGCPTLVLHSIEAFESPLNAMVANKDELNVVSILNGTVSRFLLYLVILSCKACIV